MVIAVVIEAYKKIMASDEDKNLASIRKSKVEPLARQSLLVGQIIENSGLQDSAQDVQQKKATRNLPKFEKGAFVTLKKMYDGVIDGIKLECGEEIEVMGETNNHILASQVLFY